MKILIVEDDPDIRSLLRRGLAAEGYEPLAFEDAESALASGEPVAAAVMDVGLPGLSGLELCRRMRARGFAGPALILSARSSAPERAEGLLAGADDYLAKPFDFDELLARLKAQLLRRPAGGAPDAPEGPLELGGLRLDRARRLAEGGGRAARLTEREADLLALLMRRPGEALTREEIFAALWAEQGGASANVVDVYIGYLRRKLPLDGETRARLRTARGRGFTMTTEDDA